MKCILALIAASLLSTACAAQDDSGAVAEMVNDPNWQSEMAIETLTLFEEHGEVLSHERHTIHYFYDGDHVGLGNALREMGFTVRATVDDDGVVAERMDVTDEQWRVETLTALSELANQFGSEYDGWEAAMTRQSPVNPQAAN